MTTRKRIVFAAAAMLLAVSVSLAVLLAADVYFHHRVERFAGVNIWGYRGPRVARKQPGEHRLVVIGGSTAFGYGVNSDQAFPARLESALQPLSRNRAPVTIVNLGYNTQGAYAFRFALSDYMSLDYDGAILYEGYNDLGDAPNEFIGRRESPVFRLTGYLPVLQTALREKAMAIRSGGDIDAAYRGKTVFKPGLASRTKAGTLEAAARVSTTLYAQLDRLSKVPPVAETFADVHVVDVGCTGSLAHYCASVYEAVRFGLEHHKKMLVVTQPYIGDRHREQQAQLRAMLAARFANNSDVGYADLGDAIDVRHSSLAYDGMHLTPEGNAIIASRLTAPVVALMPEAFNAPSGTDGRRNTP
jgi:hypothetical protein